MIKKVIASILVSISTSLIITLPASAATICVDAPEPTKCSSILPESWCEEGGVGGILQLVLTILTVGVGIAGTVGIVISAIQWISARDKEDQVNKAKNRILNIVIGLATWALAWSLLSWVLPGGFSTVIDVPVAPEGDNGGCPPGQVPVPDYTEEDKPNTGSEEGSNSGSNSDPGSTSPGTGSPSSYPIGNPTDSSVDIPCPANTKDDGIQDGWVSGKRTDHRICILNISGTNVKLNSRVAGAFYAMNQAAKSDGVTLKIRSSFRTFQKQMDLNSLTKTQIAKLNKQRKEGRVDRIKTGNTKLVAPPGYSFHQAGTAVDFAKPQSSYKKMYTWLVSNSTKFGFANYDEEFWHFDTSCASNRKWKGNRPSWCK